MPSGSRRPQMSRWLDNENGTACKPTELRVRTPSTEAIYGSDSPDYLHRELDQPVVARS